MAEKLLINNPNRYVVFPVQHYDIWDMFQKHRQAFWTESEIDLTSDLKDWNNLNDNERHFIKHVLAFFAGSDGIVLENLGLRFFSEVQLPEVRCFYSIQMFMETIHSIMYSQLIDTYIKDETEKTHLFQAIETIPCISKKAKWAEKWIQSIDSFAARLIAFACVEGLFFSGSFCCIYWLKERGILSGLCKSNDFIARDEGLHTDFACLLYNKYISNKLDKDMFESIVKEAVEIEHEFITESLPCSLLGMNANLMKEYICYVANRLCIQLGHSPIYENIKQPFSFMDRICFDSKDNFFEGRVTSYQMTVTKTIEDEIDTIAFDAEF